MKFELFLKYRSIVKNLESSTLLFFYWLVTEELEKRGAKIKVLETLKEI